MFKWMCIKVNIKAVLPACICFQTKFVWSLVAGRCTSDHERMARQGWGVTYLAYPVFDIVLLASTESLIGGISSACFFVTGACSLAAF